MMRGPLKQGAPKNPYDAVALLQLSLFAANLRTRITRIQSSKFKTHKIEKRSRTRVIYEGSLQYDARSHDDTVSSHKFKAQNSYIYIYIYTLYIYIYIYTLYVCIYIYIHRHRHITNTIIINVMIIDIISGFSVIDISGIVIISSSSIRLCIVFQREGLNLPPLGDPFRSSLVCRRGFLEVRLS